jgi:hypothetical protein
MIKSELHMIIYTISYHEKILDELIIILEK